MGKVTVMSEYEATTETSDYVIVKKDKIQTLVICLRKEGIINNER